MEKLNAKDTFDCAVIDRNGNRLDRHRRPLGGTPITETLTATDHIGAAVNTKVP